MYLPIIVSAIKEFDLGWDSAYFFPWLAAPPHPEHKGCNFFIQYKRSKMIEGPRGGEWRYWNESYLRFQIPYSSKDVGGFYRDDYNQFDRLKELADQKYDVYYATNHVLTADALFNLARRQQLLDETPFLNVSEIDDRHKKVTFTMRSPDFILLSEPRKIEKSKWQNMVSVLKQKKGTSLGDDIDFIEQLVLNLEEVSDSRIGGYHEEIEKIREGTSGLRMLAKGLILSKYLRRYLDLYWFRTQSV